MGSGKRNSQYARQRNGKSEANSTTKQQTINSGSGISSVEEKKMNKKIEQENDAVLMAELTQTPTKIYTKFDDFGSPLPDGKYSLYIVRFLGNGKYEVASGFVDKWGNETTPYAPDEWDEEGIQTILAEAKKGGKVVKSE